jgi:hypothetical protein
MSFPRLALLAVCLPLVAGGCAGAALTAASYGADGASYLETGKSTTDHFASMVSKKDCAFWRILRNQKICREREGDHDPYRVSYDTAERQPSESGVSYSPPLRPAPDAPVSSWTAEAYAKPAPPAPSSPEPAVAAVQPPAPPPAVDKPVADKSVAEAPAVEKPVAAHKPVKKKRKAKAHPATPVKKPPPSQVASVP